MKKLLFIFAACASLVSTQKISANQNMYIQFFSGANWVDAKTYWAHAKKHGFKNNFKAGYLVGGSVGYELGGTLRLEAEVSYRNSELQIKSKRLEKATEFDILRGSFDGRTERWSIMTNLLYNMSSPTSILKPYIGGGIGYTDSKLNLHEIKKEFQGSSLKKRFRHFAKSQHFSWQLIAGMGYAICQNVDLSVEYRYFKPSKNLYSNDLVFGAKLKF